MINKRYYAAAQKEVDEGRMDDALWTKAQAEAANLTQAYPLYIRFRAAELAQEALKDKVRVMWTKGVEAWQGKPAPVVPQRTSPLFVILLILCGVAFLLILMLSSIYSGSTEIKPSYSVTSGAAARSNALAAPNKYLWRDTHVMDVDGIALGGLPVDVDRTWPALTCKALTNSVRLCRGKDRTALLAGVPLRGDLWLAENGNGTLKLVNVAVTSSSADVLKARYDALWGASSWVTESHETGAGGWVWHHGGVALKVTPNLAPNIVSVSLMQESTQ